VTRPALQLAPWIVLACLGSACAPAPERAPTGGERLETVEVGAKLDAHASLEEDPIEIRRREPSGGISGVLPEGFPSDVPLPTPSSLVDFVAAPGEGLAVTLEVQSSPEVALAGYEAKLRAAGFGSRGGGVWSRERRRIRVSVDSFGGAARIRVEILRGGR